MLVQKFTALFVAFLFIAPLTGQTDVVQSETISRDSVATYLEKLSPIFETYHPNAYAYTTPKALAEVRAEIVAELPRQVDSATAYRAFRRYVSAYGDAHTRVYDRTGANRRAFYAAKVFPLAVQLHANELTVTAAFTGEENSHLVGRQITHVNGRPAAEVATALTNYATRETRSLDEVMVSQDFSHYYWLAFGGAAKYDLKLADGTTATLAGVEAKITRPTTQARRPALQLSYPQEGTAVLEIAHFNGQLKHFKQQFATIFAELNDRGITHLIIDARDHDGGDSRIGAELCRYFAAVPFQPFARSEYRVTEVMQANFKGTYLPGALGKLLPVLKPFHPHLRAIYGGELGGNNPVYIKAIKPYGGKKAFQGEVTLLTGANTFSAGTCLAAVFKDYQMGTIVGHETGNLANFHADALVTCPLPFGQVIKISTSYLVRPNGDETARPVQPDVALAYGEDALQAVLQGQLARK